MLEPRAFFALQSNRFDFGDEAVGVATQKRSHNVEHGVTEAADVQDVFHLRSVRGRIQPELDGDNLRRVD